MGDLAESKRNMKIDFRPRAVMRIMRLELIIFGSAMLMCVGMPLYFLKLRPYKIQYQKDMEIKKQEKLEQKMIEEEKEEMMYLRDKEQTDMNLSTV